MSWVYNYYYGETEKSQKNPEHPEETKNNNAVQEYLSNDSDLVIPEEDNFLENDDVSIDQ